MAAALTRLFESLDLRRELGARLGRRVRERYGAEAVMRQVCDVYDAVMNLRLETAARIG
jgi:hypothetical protein